MGMKTLQKTGWFQLLSPSRFHLAFREINFLAKAVDADGKPAAHMEIRLGKRVISCEKNLNDKEGEFSASFRTGKGWKAAKVWVRWENGDMRQAGSFLFYSLIPARKNQLERDYPAWFRQHGLQGDVAVRLRKKVESLPQQPLISIVLPVYNTDPKYLGEAIDSVLVQSYPNWQLCIADDASTREETKALLRDYEKKENRISLHWREKNGHISAASNSALEMAKGGWIGLLDHDDTLLPDALAQVVEEINRYPEACFFYSDEDKIAEDSRLLSPYFKPDWNPLFLESQNYICHFSVIRSDKIREVGGFRLGYEGSQDWDLFLRLAKHLPQGSIRHIPRVLYHWREIEGSVAKNIGQKNYTVQAAERALNDHFQGREYVKELVGGMYWIYAPPAQNDYEIIHCHQNRNWENAVASAKAKVIVLACEESPSSYEADTLARLSGWAMRPDLGVVSGSFFLEEEWMSEGGFLVQDDGGLLPAFRHLRKGFEGMGRREILPQNWPVPGIRLIAFRKEHWQAAGEWSRQFQPLPFQIADFCLRVESTGLRNAFLPFLRFPLSKECCDQEERLTFVSDAQRFKENWPEYCLRDPAGHPHLSIETGFFTMKWGDANPAKPVAKNSK